MAMKMCAKEFIGIGQDLVAPIRPYAAALRDPILRSHCSSCFNTLNVCSSSGQDEINTDCETSCTSCSSTVSYCSYDCFSSDIQNHRSSGECCFFQLLKKNSLASPATDTTDFRVALRLLRHFEERGMFCNFDPLLTVPPDRLGGLQTSHLMQVLEEDEEELCHIIKEGSLLMARARRMGQMKREIIFDGGITVEALSLWAVIINSVEVQVTEGQALGVAVYGPGFSWFNHSCLPNACYRFAVNADCDDPASISLDNLVLPASAEPPVVAKRDMDYEGEECCKYGPRVVVRSIKPINKYDEVCISYTDLLKNKASRQSDLWLKYRFICSCSRCAGSPKMYVDHVLDVSKPSSPTRAAASLSPPNDRAVSQCDARSLSSEDGEHEMASPQCAHLEEVLELAVEEYTSRDDPETCCELLETMLMEHSWAASTLREPDHPGWKFLLHPLHRTSLNAYMVLASAFRVSTRGSTVAAAAAYSVLLAGAVNHLFSSEPSLIAPSSHFWINAGEALLHLVRDVAHRCCKSNRAAECLSVSAVRCWPFLARGSTYLEQRIKDPFDFSWLSAGASPAVETETAASMITGEGAEEEMCSQLGMQCLERGKHLANICYGPRCYLVRRADYLLSSAPASSQ